MTERKNIGWIKFVPSLNLPKERVSIAYDTHDERGIRYAYGYFQFYNGTCGCFWKDGNEQTKVVKAEDIKYWMPVPSLDVQEDPASEDFTKALAECINQAQCAVVDPMAHAEIWKDELIKLAKSEEPLSEDLGEAVNAYIGYAPEVDESSSTYGKRQAFKDGANWQKQKDESKVLTEEQCRKLRDDAFELGKDVMKQQMMAKAVDARCFGFQGAALFSFGLPAKDYLVGSKIKVIIIKE